MPSPADARARVEAACRGLALAAVAALAWRAGAPSPASGVTVGATSALPAALRAATVAAVPSVALHADAIPRRADRAWLAALARSGTPVRWQPGATLPPLALAVEPLPLPDAGARVSVAAMPGRPVHVADGAGGIDSAVVSASGLHQVEAVTSGAVVASVGSSVARVTPVARVAPKAVLVIAQAGWEGRFVSAALQEAGWRVEVDFVVTDASAPGARTGASVRSVTGANRPDTARHAVVVALDAAAAARGPALVRFVREGGGLVLGPGALTVPSLAAIVPATAGRSMPRTLGGLRGASPRSGLDAIGLDGLRRDAVVLERRADVPVVAARREGLGRVAVTGVRDTWEWRMSGGEGAPEAHERWWSALVASVAPVSSEAPGAMVASRDEPGWDGPDPAPYADMVDRLGAPTAGAEAAPSSGRRQEPWLLAAALLLLIAEWASRRTRGLS